MPQSKNTSTLKNRGTSRMDHKSQKPQTQKILQKKTSKYTSDRKGNGNIEKHNCRVADQEAGQNTLSGISYNAMERWKGETVLEQPWNNVASFSAMERGSSQDPGIVGETEDTASLGYIGPEEEPHGGTRIEKAEI